MPPQPYAARVVPSIPVSRPPVPLAVAVFGKRGEKGQFEANFARNGARKLLDDGELEPSL
ncbi:MAG TPA: hypothetical protein PKZ25_15085 [Candidatus Hydrogenedentes bacterium]|nr:hypothetical protein [Candidatus Hydrogenedentota bacterium]